ncbi:MAG: RNA 2',3'-cyclic phosphodiesterase, partial [Elusimicrobiota bacterium]|nr:RNA 2',3'-cyclic phosphodiesterase [Elusimicrobiota bacterium]
AKRSKGLRLFVASAFEPGFVKNLEAIEGYARANSAVGTVKWVEPENFHITYAFLGDLEQSARAVRGMEAGLDGLKAFSVSSGGFGVFPSPRRPAGRRLIGAVLWVGIAEGAARLSETAEKLAGGLAAEGLVFENRFEPHVTIGRVKGPLPENFLRRAADFAQAKKAVSALSSVDLLESVLTPAGPKYRTVFSKKLL